MGYYPCLPPPFLNRQDDGLITKSAAKSRTAPCSSPTPAPYSRVDGHHVPSLSPPRRTPRTSSGLDVGSGQQWTVLPPRASPSASVAHTTGSGSPPCTHTHTHTHARARPRTMHPHNTVGPAIEPRRALRFFRGYVRARGCPWRSLARRAGAVIAGKSLSRCPLAPAPKPRCGAATQRRFGRFS